MATTLDSVTVDLDPVLDGQMALATGAITAEDADQINLLYSADARPIGCKGSLLVRVKNPANAEVAKVTIHGDLNETTGLTPTSAFAVVNGVSTNLDVFAAYSTGAGAAGQYTVEFMVAGKLPSMKVGISIGNSSIVWAELSGRGPHGATLKATKA